MTPSVKSLLHHIMRHYQCFARPYLGCREFAAWFGEPDGTERPIDRSEGLGLMLLDMEYDPDGTGRGTPHFFQAYLDRGVLRLPTAGSTEEG